MAGSEGRMLKCEAARSLSPAVLATRLDSRCSYVVTSGKPFPLTLEGPPKDLTYYKRTETLNSTENYHHSLLL